MFSINQRLARLLRGIRGNVQKFNSEFWVENESAPIPHPAQRKMRNKIKKLLRGSILRLLFCISRFRMAQLPGKFIRVIIASQRLKCNIWMTWRILN